MIELLAEYAHKAWSGWMIYLFSFCIRNEDGSVTIPKDKVARWSRQMNTPYSALPDNEKESDRIEARSMINIVKQSSEK